MSGNVNKSIKNVELRTNINNLNAFLVKYKIETGKGLYHTHTAFGPPYGTFNIPDDKIEEFTQLYCKALGNELHIVERPKLVGPLLIDIDFHVDDKDRKYNDNDIVNIISTTNDIIEEYFSDLDNNQLKYAYVMEKQTPTKKGNEYKDGFHIIYPNLAISESMRFLIIHELKTICVANKFLNHIKFTNSINEVFDTSVIKNNGWMMYGSKKHNCQVYKLTAIYDENINPLFKIDDDDKKRPIHTHATLVKILSNRKFSNSDELMINKDIDQDDFKNKIDNVLRICGVTKSDKNIDPNKVAKTNTNKNKNYNYDDVDGSDDEYEDDGDDNDSSDSDIDDDENDGSGDDSDENDDGEYDSDTPPAPSKNKDKKKKKGSDEKIAELLKKKVQENEEKRMDELKNKEIELAKKFVAILNRNRSTEYESWTEIGWALHNISPTALKSTFIEFSKKSPKYDRDSCEKLWQKARAAGFTISRIKYYAQIDNPKQYMRILRENISSLLEDATNGGEDDITKILFELYGDIYKCVNIKGEDWYEFQGHRWVNVESGYTLYSRISVDLNREFALLASYFLQQCDANNDHTNDNYRLKAEKIFKLMKRLKTTAFKGSIMRDCARKFYDPTFEGLLDSNPDLLGFDNGIYDLKHMTFRKGRPSDMVSMTTGYSYKLYSMNHKHIVGIKDYFSKIMIEEDMREYVLTLLASYLDGHIRGESFIIWTGSGCLGAGTMIRMADGSLKKVEDIIVGDKLMGENNNVKNVLELFSNHGALYRVDQDGYNSYVVNQAHRMSFNFVGDMTYDDDGLLTWYEHDSKAMIKICKRKFNSKDIAMDFISKNKNVIEKGHRIICTVNNYLKLGKQVQELLYGHNINGDVYDVTIQYIGDGQFYGFELDDKTFVLEDGTITCNSNGKSKTVELFQMAMGDYSTILPVTVLTQKKGSASSPNCEIAQLRGIRFAVLQEPEGKDEIQIGSMKEMTGGDYLYARKLFGHPFKFKPQFKLLMTCNKLPHIDGNDNGTWRRIKVTPFESEFTNEPILPHQFMRDNELIAKLQKWNKAFMWYLLEVYYPKYRSTQYKIYEPEKVTMHTKNYKKNSDIFLDFIETNLTNTKKSSDFESLDSLYALMKQWYADSYAGKCPYNKNQFVEYLGTNNYKIDKSYLYKYTFRNEEGPTLNGDDDDEDDE